MTDVKSGSRSENQHYDFETISSKHAFEQAKKNDEIVQLPMATQLFLDLDSEEAVAIFNKNLPKFELHFREVKLVTRRPSRNGNTHVIVELHEEVDPETRIMYQLFLGSDPMREMLSMIRVEYGDPHPTLFIEKKPQLLIVSGTIEDSNRLLGTS